MEKIPSIVRRFIWAAILLYIVCFIASSFHDNRIVAIIEGNKIYYNDATYTESFEVFDFDKDRCLGSVRFSEDSLRHKIYSLHGKPEYIYVDMFLDYRLYVRVSDK